MRKREDRRVGEREGGERRERERERETVSIFIRRRRFDPPNVDVTPPATSLRSARPTATRTKIETS